MSIPYRKLNYKTTKTRVEQIGKLDCAPIPNNNPSKQTSDLGLRWLDTALTPRGARRELYPKLK